MKISCFVFNFFKLQTVQQMPYYMNRDKLDRYMLTRPRNICPKTALNPSTITQFAKVKPANFMEAVLSLTT